MAGGKPKPFHALLSFTMLATVTPENSPYTIDPFSPNSNKFVLDCRVQLPDPRRSLGC